MTIACLARVGILAGVLGTSTLCAGDLSNYRGFQFGANLSMVAKQARTTSSEARLVHQRPAVIQELDWRPRSLIQADPVQDGTLYFYDGELFRIVVTYDRYKVEGMTAEDMVEAISATYGTATRPTVEIAYHSIYGESAPVMARWEDSQYSYNLIATGDRSSFAMVLYSKRVEALAQAATVEAARVEALEAPRRELEKQKKRDDEDRIALEKARSVNKPKFRP
jgi:hypothetical protein